MSRLFDQLSGELLRQVDLLEPSKKAAFSAACAERLMGLYSQFCTEQHWDRECQLRKALNSTWDAIGGSSLEISAADALDMVASVVPHADDFDSVLITAAQDAAICADLALRFLLGQGDSAPVSVSYALEGVASVEAARSTGVLGFGDTQADREKDSQVLHSVSVQNELRYQNEDVGSLAGANVSDVVELLRTRAKKNAHV